jgi:hypothetical protein
VVGQVASIGAVSRRGSVGGVLLKTLAFLGVFLLGGAAVVAFGVYLAATDNTAQLDTARETALLRTRDLLKRTRNTRLEIQELRTSLAAGGDLRMGVGGLSDRLADYWVFVAAYGVGTDPYPDRVRTASGGAWPVKPTPDYGFAGTEAYGVPRLFDRVLALEELPDAYRRDKAAELDELVAPFANPGMYPLVFRDFYERTRGHDRDPEELGAYMRSPAFAVELDRVDAWLESLAERLERLAPLLTLEDRPRPPREWWRFWQPADVDRTTAPSQAIGTRA